MKEVSATALVFVLVIAFVFTAVQPASAAAGFVVSTATANRNGSVVVYLEYSSTPFFASTTTFVQGIGYYTFCSPSGSGLLKCTINGQIAKYHANHTAYIIMNGSADNKAFFTVPEYEQKEKCKDSPPNNDASYKESSQCCDDWYGGGIVRAPCPDY
ncbi:MAG: hypothetical protein HFACDABA_02929 [Anaerolineales bacterium]|nr:hypothetical protein [Anaerolineales bacterium]